MKEHKGYHKVYHLRELRNINYITPALLATPCPRGHSDSKVPPGVFRGELYSRNTKEYNKLRIFMNYTNHITDWKNII